MNVIHKMRLTILSLAGALVVAGLAWHLSRPGDATASLASAGSSNSTAPMAWWTPSPPDAASTSSAQGKPTPPASMGMATPARSGNPLDNIVQPVFKANAQGSLVINPTTGVDVERLQALNTRDEAAAKLAELSRDLPDKAQRELKELHQQYVQYSQAVAQTYPPGLGVDSVDDAARQLEGLHALRQQYFGPERAQQLFDEEEQTSRELMALMRQEKEAMMSLDDRATRAQDAWKKNHLPPP